MERDQELKKYILENGLLQQDQLAQAEDYALTMGLALEQSIIFLQLMDFGQLGGALQAIYGVPYRPLLQQAPSEDMKKVIPLSMAEKFGVFPLAYDPGHGRITLAIDDPFDQERMDKITRLLAPSNSPEFTVASRPEINQAIDIYYKGKTYTHQIQVELPKEFTIVAPRPQQSVEKKESASKKKAVIVDPELERFRALKTLLKIEDVETLGWVQAPEDLRKIDEIEYADLVLINGETYRDHQPALAPLTGEASFPPICYYYPRAMLLDQAPPYREMGDALVSLVSFLVKKALKKAPSKLRHTLALVRYCKLLSLRLGLSPPRIDAVVLAAWLCTSNFGSTLAESIQTPYGLEQVLAPQGDKSGVNRIEREILSLVREYLNRKETDPEAVRDTEAIRKTLGSQYKTGQRRVIFETFVQVIRDEGLLGGIEEDKGTILIIAKDVDSDSDLILRLNTEGYEVHLHESASQAREAIFSFHPNIILCEIMPNDKQALELCKAVKLNKDISGIPFFFIATDDASPLATECLEIGADDFLVQPIDPDLLTLKIRRALSARATARPTKGIEGSLAEMNAMEIIQSVATGDKNVKITLEHNGNRGSIFIKGGEIIHAETGPLVGEEALFQLMAYQDGQFQVVSCDSFPQRTIHAGTMSLLMEGARLVDEASATDEVEDI